MIVMMLMCVILIFSRRIIIVAVIVTVLHEFTPTQPHKKEIITLNIMFPSKNTIGEKKTRRVIWFGAASLSCHSSQK